MRGDFGEGNKREAKESGNNAYDKMLYVKYQCET